ncbi:MAG: hydrogenase maturation nickel metallochaperone HypA [Deltaproteobacteria bacterium]|nr:hydrogenase maturation nickel metallochaperone HypA [Deltaproteobacteria bacterium]
MHELSVANSLAEQLLKLLKDNGGGRVVSALISIGELGCVNRDSLKFSFEIVNKDTVLETCRLEFLNVPAKLKCHSCCFVFEGMQREKCPVCDCENFFVISGKEVVLERVEIEK